MDSHLSVVRCTGKSLGYYIMFTYWSTLLVDFIRCFGFVCFIAGERSRWILNCLSCVVRVFTDLIHGFVFASLLESVVDGFICFILLEGVVDGFIGDHSLRQGSIIDNILEGFLSM